MARLKPIKISDFQGGLDLNDSTTIDDNELSIAKNMFYDQEKRLTSRRGVSNFGDAIPDTVLVLNDCEATTNFVATDDAAAVATGAAIRGANSVEFDIIVATTGSDFATLTNASLGTLDITNTKGYLGFWLFVPTAFNTNLTDVKVRLGSDATNYYEWTLGTLTENANNFIKLSYADATTVLTPVDTSIDLFRLQVTYTAGYTDKLNLLLDDIYSYSTTSTDAVHSLFFWEDSIGTRRLLAGCGTNLFQYNDDNDNTTWDILRTGLTDGSKFSFAPYGDVLYLTNGDDEYMDYDGVVVTDRTQSDTRKGRYLITANDVGYIAGVDGARSVLYYSASAPADMQIFGNALDIEEDNGQIITGLANLGPIVLVFKESSIYDVNIATPERNQIDYSGGAQSHRSIVRVENDVLFLSDNGLTSLAQREGTTGSLRATPISKDLQPLIDFLRNKDISAGEYWPRLNQYYLAVDSSNSGQNDTVLVYNVLNNAFTRYVGINANDFAIYQDSASVESMLYASAYGGRVVQMETGFDDNGVSISSEVGTKKYDFDEPSLTKEYREVDVIGFISESAELEFTVEVDDEEVSTATVLGATYLGSTSTITLGTDALGINPLTGEAIVGEEIVLNLFKARLPVYRAGIHARVKLKSNKENTAWVLNKMHIVPEIAPFDFYSNSEIL